MNGDTFCEEEFRQSARPASGNVGRTEDRITTMTPNTDSTSSFANTRLTTASNNARIAPPTMNALSFSGAPPMLYPNHYVWFVFVSSLDVILTWVIVLLGGAEANPIADAVLQHAGLNGMVAFKFCIVIFVVIMCEWVGKREPRTGFKLAEWSVAISAIPIVAAFVQLPMLT